MTITMPTYRATGAQATGTTSQVSVGLPSGIATGDICFLVATTVYTATISITANGGGSWTALTGSPVSDTGEEKIYVWWRRHASGDSAPGITATADHVNACTICFYDCRATSTPIDVTTTGYEAASDTSLSFATGLSTTVDNDLVLLFSSTGADKTVAQHSAQANSNLSSVTERADYCTNTGGGGGFECVAGGLATHGAIGTWTATLANASYKAYITCGLLGYNLVDTNIDVSSKFKVYSLISSSKDFSSKLVPLKSGSIDISSKLKPLYSTSKDISAKFKPLFSTYTDFSSKLKILFSSSKDFPSKFKPLHTTSTDISSQIDVLKSDYLDLSSRFTISIALLSGYIDFSGKVLPLKSQSTDFSGKFIPLKSGTKSLSVGLKVLYTATGDISAKFKALKNSFAGFSSKFIPRYSTSKDFSAIFKPLKSSFVTISASTKLPLQDSTYLSSKVKIFGTFSGSIDLHSSLSILKTTTVDYSSRIKVLKSGLESLSSRFTVVKYGSVDVHSQFDILYSVSKSYSSRFGLIFASESSISSEFRVFGVTSIDLHSKFIVGAFNESNLPATFWVKGRGGKLVIDKTSDTESEEETSSSTETGEEMTSSDEVTTVGTSRRGG